MLKPFVLRLIYLMFIFVALNASHDEKNSSNQSRVAEGAVGHLTSKIVSELSPYMFNIFLYFSEATGL